MKKLLFSIIISHQLLFAIYGTTSSPEQKYEERYKYSEDPTDIRVQNNELEDINNGNIEVVENLENENIKPNVESSVKQKSEQEVKKRKEFLIKLQKREKEFFHKSYVYETLDLKCPPLKQEHSYNYAVITDSVDPFKGSVRCSVYQKPFVGRGYSKEYINALEKPKIKRLKTKTFVNDFYLKQLKIKSDIANSYNYIDEEALAVTEDFESRLKFTKQALLAKYNGIGSSDKYLNFADALDAVMTFNSNIIDLQKSFDTNSLVFQDGYIAMYLDVDENQKVKNTRKKLNQMTHEINSQFEIFPVMFERSPDKDVYQELSEFDKLFTSKLNMLIHFLIKNNHFINDLIIFLMFPLIFLAIHNLGKYVLEKEKINKFHLSFQLVLLLTLVNITFTSDAIDVFDEQEKKNYTVELNTLQEFTHLLSDKTNSLADELTLAVFDSYANSLYSATSLGSEQILKVGQELSKNQFIKEKLAEINAKCLNIYDIPSIKADYPLIFQKNPNLTFIPDNMLKKRDYSVYNTVDKKGYVKNIYLFEQYPLSLTTCSIANRNLNSITSQINLASTRIELFNNIDYQNKVYTQKELLLEDLYNKFNRLGYLSVPYIFIQDSWAKLMGLPSKKAEEWQALFDFDIQKSANYFTENFLFFMLFGQEVQDIVSKAVAIPTNATVGWLPFVGETLSKVASNTTGFIASIMFVDILNEAIPTLRGLLMWALSMLMFFLFFVGKFVIFWILPFVFFYALATQAFEKVFKLALKAVIIFLKPVILIFIVFLSFFIIDVSHNFIYMSIDDMMGLIAGGGFISNTIAYIIKSVAVFLAIILEFLVAYALIVNGTRSVISFFEISADDISDSITSTIGSTIQNKTIK